MTSIDSKKITFKKALKTDKKQVRQWLDEPHVKAYWDDNAKMWEEFESYVGGAQTPSDYWICSYDKKPYGLITTSDLSEFVSRTDRQNEPLIPWVEPDGATWMIDFAIGEEAFLGKGLSSETLKRFGEIQAPFVKAFLVSPEVQEEKALHVYEKAGFVKVSTFIKGQGFFKGKPHYLLKMKL